VCGASDMMVRERRRMDGFSTIPPGGATNNSRKLSAPAQ
jgi:hypothetical protein